MNSIHKFAGVLILIFWGMSQSGYSQQVDSLLNEATTKLHSGQEQEALDIFLKVLETNENNFEALWHTSLLYARIGYRMENEDRMMEQYQRAFDYAEKTLERYPDEGLSHFVYAVANGRISDLSETKIRIEKAHVVKEHANKAVDMMPEFGPAWHVLAMWHSKVANVGSTQRFAAGLFSKGIPDGASNQKAVEFIQKAIELNPEERLRYTLDLARHYERAGQDQKAIEVLEEVVEMNAENDIDKWNLDRAKELLDKLS